MSQDYSGSVLLPDGRVLFIPCDANTIAFYNTKTNLISKIVPTVSDGIPIPSTASKWVGGVLLPSGNVFFVPQSFSQAAMYDPYNNLLTYGPTLTGFAGGVLLPSGNIVCVPYTSTTIAEVNPSAGTIKSTTHGSGGSSPYCFSGFLMPSGNVFLSPYSGNAMQYSTTLGVSNIAGYTASVSKYSGCCFSPQNEIVLIPNGGGNFGHVSMNGIFTTSTATGYYSTGCLMNNGKIALGGINMGIYNVYTDTVTRLSSYPGNGGVAIPDGRAIFAPGIVINGSSPIDSRAVLSPYLNKGL